MYNTYMGAWVSVIGKYATFCRAVLEKILLQLDRHSIALYKSNTDGQQCTSRHDYCALTWRVFASYSSHLHCPRWEAINLNTCQTTGSETVLTEAIVRCVSTNPAPSGALDVTMAYTVHRQCFHKMEHKQPR